jgi:hypothetical protein
MPPEGSGCAVCATAECAEFMFDNHATMSCYGQLLNDKFPDSQEAC